MRQKLLDLVDSRVTEAEFIDSFCARLINEKGYPPDNLVKEMVVGSSFRADLVIADSETRSPIAIVEFKHLPERNNPKFLQRLSRYCNIWPAAHVFSIHYSQTELRVHEHFFSGGKLESRELVEFPSLKNLQMSNASSDAERSWSGPSASKKSDLSRVIFQTKRKLNELATNVAGERSALPAFHTSVVDDVLSQLDLKFSDLGVPEPWKTDDDLFSAVFLFSEELDATISKATANENPHSRTLASILQELQAGLRKVLTSDVLKRLPRAATRENGNSSPIGEPVPSVDILVITAMLEPEYTEVLSVIENQTHEKVYRADHSHCIRGKLIDTSASVIVATQNDMGMANAGILATKLILRYRPKYVVMTGIAAGIDAKTQQVGDILVPSHTYDLAMGKLEEDEDMSLIFKPKPYQKDARDLFSPHAGDILRSMQDTEFLNTLSSVLRAALPDAYKKLTKRSIKVHYGTFGSGGTVIAAEKEAKFYKQINGGLIGFDMEAHAVVIAAAECGLENKPKVLVAKAICDFAGTDKRKNKDLKQKLAARASAIYFHHFFVNYVFTDD